MTFAKEHLEDILVYKKEANSWSREDEPVGRMMLLKKKWLLVSQDS